MTSIVMQLAANLNETEGKHVKSRHTAFVSTQRFMAECSDTETDTLPDITSAKTEPAEGVFLVSTLLRFRATMCNDDDDDVRKLVCQARLAPPTYESTSPSISKVVAPVRHHQIPQPMAPTAGSQAAATHDDNAKVARASLSILNKITAETCDSQFEKLATCGIEQPEHISTLMSQVFDVATDQHQFIPTYADLCMKLEQDPRIAAAGNFRRLLLNKCQAVLEQLVEPCDAALLSLDEELCLQRKQKALGNIKLIGHLLLNGMLTSKLLMDCADELISKRSTCPEAMESLAALLMVAAPTFDTTEWQYYDRLQTCFGTMRKLVKDKTMLPRGRFLLRDVLDVREAGWPTSTKNPAVVQPAVQPADEAKESAASMTPQKEPETTFDLRAFRRTLAAILTDLTSNRNVSGAVARVRHLEVPLERQAEQYTDLITRIVEEKRGPARRCAMAFAAGLGVAEQPAFDREQCLLGIVSFFEDVYPDLCNEVARLPAIVRSELTPTLYSVFQKAEIDSRLPPGVRF